MEQLTFGHIPTVISFKEGSQGFLRGKIARLDYGNCTLRGNVDKILLSGLFTATEREYHEILITFPISQSTEEGVCAKTSTHNLSPAFHMFLTGIFCPQHPKAV